MTTKERWKDDPERLKMVRKANKAYAKACRGLTPDEERQKWDEYSYKMLHAEPFGDNVRCRFHPDGCQKAMDASHLRQAKAERKAWDEQAQRERHLLYRIRNAWCFDDAMVHVLGRVFALLKFIIIPILVFFGFVAFAGGSWLGLGIYVGLAGYAVYGRSPLSIAVAVGFLAFLTWAAWTIFGGLWLSSSPLARFWMAFFLIAVLSCWLADILRSIIKSESVGNFIFVTTAVASILLGVCVLLTGHWTWLQGL